MRVLNHSIENQTFVSSDGQFIGQLDQTVTLEECEVCGAREVTHGILEHLMFESDHRHDTDAALNADFNLGEAEEF